MAKPLAIGVITGFQNGAQAALEVVQDLGIPTVQIGYPAALDNENGVSQIEAALAKTGIEITTVFCGFAGESYADIPTVQETVGLVPEKTRAERVQQTMKIAEFAHKIGVARVAAHIGFVPEDHADPRYAQLVEVTRRICNDLQTRVQIFALETGQETAPGLKHFIEDVKVDNLRVNFDPANMILYGNDEPIPALNILMPWIDGVHAKDGKWPTPEGQKTGQLGEETPLGEGDVNMAAWLKKLLDLGYRGPITIEREISGDKQKEDIRQGKNLLEDLLRENGF